MNEVEVICPSCGCYILTGHTNGLAFEYVECSECHYVGDMEITD